MKYIFKENNKIFQPKKKENLNNLDLKKKKTN